MKLKYNNICVRNAEPADCEQLAAWWNDGRVMAHAGFPNGIGTTADEVRKKIAGDSDETTRRMVIECDDRLIGETNFSVYEGVKYEIGIKICETDCQEKGIGRLVLSMIIEELFGRGAKLISLDTNLKNTRAQHVYELLGFKKVAVNIDSWEDQLGVLQSSVVYELVREDFVNFKKINLIFDCDGTLVDSYLAIVDSIKRLFAAHEIEYESEEIRQLALHHSVTYCVTELARRSGLEPEEMLKELNDYPENIDVMKLYPEEEKLLGDKRFRCFVFTHRGASCREIFERFGITDCFEEIVDGE